MEIVKQAESRSYFQSERISKDEFVSFMQHVFLELSKILFDVTERIDILSNCAKNNLLPAYLQPGQVFLGKFFI